MNVWALLDGCEGFEWDEGNALKSWVKHGITHGEAEQIFFNEPLLTDDMAHSMIESRFGALGRADNGKYLFVAFTVRNKRIRVISARMANRKERETYEKSQEAA